MARGKRIVMEGLDGSGKATQTGLLCQYLESRGRRVRHIEFPDYREPSSALVKMYLNKEFGSNPGDVNAYAASSFYAVDRYASFLRFWRKDYLSGATIVADRYTTSNAVYQMEKTPREDWNKYLAWLQDYEYGKLQLPRPDLVLFLDICTKAMWNFEPDAAGPPFTRRRRWDGIRCPALRRERRGRSRIFKEISGKSFPRSCNRRLPLEAF